MPQDWRSSREAAALIHATFFFATLIGPLVVIVGTRTRRESLAFRAAAQAFNWQVAWVAAALTAHFLNLPDIGILRFVSFVGLLALIAVGVTASGRAVMRAARGLRPRYPFRVRLVSYAE